MKSFRCISKHTRWMIIAAVALILYGYLCRGLKIYFFWESLSIGWTLFWFTLISILRDTIIRKRALNRNTTLQKIGIGIAVFVLLIKTILYVVIPRTDAYDTAVKHILTDPRIREQAGHIDGFYLVPAGGMATSSGSQGTTGEAELQFVVKGSRKFMDLTLLLEKDYQTSWIIIDPVRKANLND